MYTSSIDLHIQPAVKPLFNTVVYERIADMYRLPPMETILGAIARPSEYINWGDTSYSSLEAYHLEDMIAPPYGNKYVLEFRFRASREARKKTSLFMSVQNGLILQLSIQFPGRAGRTAGSYIIAIIKSVAHNMRFHPGAINLEIEGFYEVDKPGWIREKTLSAFVWQPGLDRYLHVDENPTRVRDTRDR